MEFNLCTGSVRVVLLVMMTAGFSTIWSNDQRPDARPSAVVVRDRDESRPVQPPALSIETHDDDWVAIESIPVSPVATAAPLADFDACLDFPRELAPGEFRIRNRQGEWLRVTVAKLDEPSPSEPVATTSADRAAGDELKRVFSSAWTTIESPIARAARPLRNWLRPEFDLAVRPVEAQ